jgi:hypothetical protein
MGYYPLAVNRDGAVTVGLGYDDASGQATEIQIHIDPAVVRTAYVQVTTRDGTQYGGDVPLGDTVYPVAPGTCNVNTTTVSGRPGAYNLPSVYLSIAYV